MGKVTHFFGCGILRGGKLVHEGLWIRDGVVVDPEEVQYTADVSIDCRGAIIAPGFIDIKLNGAMGVAFSNPETISEEKMKKVRAFLPYTGVTLFCPTVETSTKEAYGQVLPLLKKCAADPTEGAGILGVHLDGPFISIIGAHKKEAVRDFGETPGETIKEVYGNDIENVAIVTMAPELAKSSEAIRHFTRLGIKVSLGHSKADINTAEHAVRDGASMISHLFNAMPDFHHRDPGLVGLVTSDKIPRPLKFTIISDMYHVHPAALRMAYRIAPEALLLCTDGQAPLGLGPGEYDFNGTAVVVKEVDGRSVCYRAGSPTLYGSVCPLHRAVRNLGEITDCSLPYALEAVTKRPAEVMGIYPKKGSLEFGADADIVLLEPGTLNLVATFIAGQKCADNGLLGELQGVPITCEAPEYYSPTLKRTSLPEVPERLHSD
ncbi:N-acetylglucosamine-6-phosphate deacetylase [Gregarina niphandrodes]|uniref:N-acetylglucosamine-6-phosphate deacetylase n=1 Tax=Gregarina niphandrodes TaxID=110365 RepID=A0A023AX77_GRENI|nr:N-acetylglucosamine-6-phosphate deacetylase [Gregarina niphandrodes]EZG43336.1 N-acetylglucosamine-6-phosphate deacetylase [Gregarina niphandrodes]|eukprot:XP_011133407.1 N-acetylglucosamine-6-phosphate deacetylase [Gregarina niphandrodes]